jgi:MGT family glycosyltransferase
MKGLHVAFISFPHPPHVNPTLPIVSVLIRRGFRVTYATSTGFASRVAALGAEVVPCPTFDANSAAKSGDHLQPFCHHAVSTLAEITSFYEKDRPDVIIYDFLALAGRILAKRLSIPAIQTSPTFAHDEDVWPRQMKSPELRRSIVEVGDQIDSFLEQHGIVDGNFVFFRERLNVYFFPRTLQPQSQALRGDCFFAGRCAGEQPYYGEWQWSDSGDRPLAVVGTSTTYVQGPDYFRLCIAALSDLKWHVVLSVGSSCDPESLMPLPDHFEIVQNISHIRILRHASLYICLGGIITTSEAMYHGLPLIVTTHGAGELEWQGDNIEELGIGVHLRAKDMNPQNLRKTAIRVSSDRKLLDRVKEVQRIVQREPGAEETATRISEYLENCQ